MQGALNPRMLMSTIIVTFTCLFCTYVTIKKNVSQIYDNIGPFMWPATRKEPQAPNFQTDFFIWFDSRVFSVSLTERIFEQSS